MNVIESLRSLDLCFQSVFRASLAEAYGLFHIASRSFRICRRKIMLNVRLITQTETAGQMPGRFQLFVV
jgi:hypothetical protein